MKLSFTTLRAGTNVLALFFVILSSLVGCSTYTGQLRQDREKIVNGDFLTLLPELSRRADIENKDQLISILDYASALQWAGEYKKSAQQFLRADRLAEQLDYVSVSKTIGSALGGEESVQYKGESYEKFLINSLNALNYLMMNDSEAALVEARRINEKIVRTKMEGRPPYEQSSWAPFLSGILWESEGNWDNATISYETAFKIDPTNPFLPEALVRANFFARRMDAYKKWRQKFPDVKEPINNSKFGEIIFIHLQGWIPEKVPAPDEYRIPVLRSVASRVHKARLRISQDKKSEALHLVQDVYQIGAEAKRTLAADRGALIARRVGGIAAKAIVSDQIRQKDSTLGTLAWIAMNIADRADLRQWGMAPDRIQLARVTLPPGVYSVLGEGLGDSGEPLTTKSFGEVKIEGSKKTFLIMRSIK